jgi:hypothetical protein
VRLKLFSILLLGPFTLFAQHGTARSGQYPANYKMHTFTGVLLDYDPEMHIMTMECDVCAEKDKFIAELGDPEASKVLKWMVNPRDANRRKITAYKRDPAPDTISVGDILRVYYIEHTRKEDGRKVKYNAVFEMEAVSQVDPDSVSADTKP